MGNNNDHSELLLVGGVLAISYFGIIKPITDKLGLTQSQKDKALGEITYIASNNPAWNPGFYHEYTAKNKRWLIMNDKLTTTLAKKLENAWGVFKDDEQAIYSIFRSLKSQLWLSQLVEKYAQLYNRDLLTTLKAPWYYLHDGLDEQQFGIVADIVNKLPANIYK